MIFLRGMSKLHVFGTKGSWENKQGSEPTKSGFQSTMRACVDSECFEVFLPTSQNGQMIQLDMDLGYQVWM